MRPFSRISMALLFAAMASPALAYSEPPGSTLPERFHFEPAWREKGDCGPVSVHVLRRLYGEKSDLAEVKRAIPFDPVRGTSIAELCDGARRLGLDCEVRFLTPRLLPALAQSGPFILHCSGGLQDPTGHFAVVTGYSGDDGGVFGIINTSDASYGQITAPALRKMYSGYVLAPQKTFSPSPARHLGVTLIASAALAWAVLTPTRQIARTQRASAAHSPEG